MFLKRDFFKAFQIPTLGARNLEKIRKKKIGGRNIIYIKYEAQENIFKGYLCVKKKPPRTNSGEIRLDKGKNLMQ